MIEAVNILEQLSKDFWEKIVSLIEENFLNLSICYSQESKQWKDRKDSLDDLLTLLTKHPKPTPESDYSELIKILKKVSCSHSTMGLKINLCRSSARIVISLLFLLLPNVCQHWLKVYDKHFETMPWVYVFLSQEILFGIWIFSGNRSLS